MHVGLIFSSDSFYAARPELTQRMVEYGVLAVEMEASALYTLAAKHGRRALAICTVSDHIVTGEETSRRSASRPSADGRDRPHRCAQPGLTSRSSSSRPGRSSWHDHLAGADVVERGPHLLDRDVVRAPPRPGGRWRAGAGRRWRPGWSSSRRPGTRRRPRRRPRRSGREPPGRPAPARTAPPQRGATRVANGPASNSPISSLRSESSSMPASARPGRSS